MSLAIYEKTRKHQTALYLAGLCALLLAVAASFVFDRGGSVAIQVGPTVSKAPAATPIVGTDAVWDINIGNGEGVIFLADPGATLIFQNGDNLCSPGPESTGPWTCSGGVSISGWSQALRVSRPLTDATWSGSDCVVENTATATWWTAAAGSQTIEVSHLPASPSAIVVPAENCGAPATKNIIIEKDYFDTDVATPADRPAINGLPQSAVLIAGPSENGPTTRWTYQVPESFDPTTLSETPAPGWVEIVCLETTGVEILTVADVVFCNQPAETTKTIMIEKDYLDTESVTPADRPTINGLPSSAVLLLGPTELGPITQWLYQVPIDFDPETLTETPAPGWTQVVCFDQPGLGLMSLPDVVFCNQPAREAAINVHKALVSTAGTANGEGWTFTLTGSCTSTQVAVTNASGNASFGGLQAGCTYTVTETQKAGWSPVTLSQTTTPAGGQTVTLTFTNVRNEPGCITSCFQAPPTATPTPPPPTATSVPPTQAPPTQPPTATPTPNNSGAVAGAETSPTPKPPATGTGGSGGSAGDMLLVLLGLAAIGGGMSLVTIGARLRSR